MTTNPAAPRWRELREAFDEIVPLEPAAREERLAAITDLSLRDGMRRLLNFHDDYTDSGVFGGVPIGASVATTLHRIDLSLDASVDGFRIERVLGEGGMGRVYQATRNVGDNVQKVALKVVPFALSDPRVMQMLRREREILVNLNHPGIARLIDAGELRDDRPYFAMEYVDGVPITQYVESHTLDTRARLALFLDVCDAVAYAHRQLVLHRDLKPSNILVDMDGRVRLLDFGIAKSLESTGMHDTTLDAGFFSLSSAAPEQVLGRPTTVATDVYGLGCVMYQILVGRAPFPQESNTRESIIRAIAEQPAPLASASARTAEERAALLGDIDSIIAKALRKQPSDRYRSADALSADVRNVLEYRPIEARASERWYRFSMLLRRNRTVVLVAAVLGVGVLTATASSIWHSWRAGTERDRAIDALVSAQRERDHARQVSDFLVSVFQGGRSIKDRDGSMRADELLESAVQSLEEDVDKRNPELRARISQTLARLFYRLGKNPQALHQAELAHAAFAQVEAPEIGLAAAQALTDADAAYIQTRYKEAATVSGAMLERVGDGSIIEDGLVLFSLWSVYGRATSMSVGGTKAIAEYDKAIDQLSRRADVSADRIDELKQLRGALVSDSGDFAGARALFETLLVEQRARGGLVSIQIETLRQLAIACSRQRDYVSAHRYADEAVTRHIELFGEDTPRGAQLLRALAVALGDINRSAEAIQVFRRSIDIGARRIGAVSSSVGLIYLALAGEYRFGMRELGQAEFAARRGIEATPPELRLNRINALLVLGDVLVAQGRYFEAESEYDEADRLLVELRLRGEWFALIQIDLAYLKLRRFDVDGARKLMTPDVVALYQSMRAGSRNVDRSARFDEIAAAFGFVAYR